MEQTTFPIYKSPPMRPFLSAYLVTSTPDSHQISKRIKGLLGYSEHYKGNKVDYQNISPKFSPLRTRDYRKARELTLEIWDPMIQASFLEKFLKSQRNLHTIRVLTKQKYKKELLERLCGILSKSGRPNRVQIDFSNGQVVEQVKLFKIEGIESMRLLPKLKDLDVTLDGRQLLPYSASLTKVGFDRQHPLVLNDIEKLMKKTSKFLQLDTIKIDCKNSGLFAQGLDLVISKLPNLRELDDNYYDKLDLCFGNTPKILDMFPKALKLEILRMGYVLEGRSQIALLKHPIFKVKSLKRTSLSFRLVDDLSTSGNVIEIFDLLGEIPSLYELSMNFAFYYTINIYTAESQMEKISRMTSIRKLKIAFDSFAGTLSEKQAGNILKLIFKMHFLEELDLRLPQNCLEGNGQDISLPPRLKKASLHFKRWKSNRADDMKTMAEILGKCHQLRELELIMHDCVYDYQGVTIKLIENLRKLKRLQVLKLDTSTSCKEGSNMTMDIIEDLLKTCHEMRNLQDLHINMVGFDLYAGGKNLEALQRFFNLKIQFSMYKKYRFCTFNCA